MLLGPGLMYFLACFDTLLEAERATNPKGFSPYRGDSASAGARHPSWPAAFTLPARWDAAENRARKGRYPSSESARVLVDQYFVDSLAVVFYVGVEPDRAVWPGAGVHVHDVGAGTAVDGVSRSCLLCRCRAGPCRLARSWRPRPRRRCRDRSRRCPRVPVRDVDSVVAGKIGKTEGAADRVNAVFTANKSHHLAGTCSWCRPLGAYVQAFGAAGYDHVDHQDRLPRGDWEYRSPSHPSSILHGSERLAQTFA